jgi:hypothetical protein
MLARAYLSLDLFCVASLLCYLCIDSEWYTMLQVHCVQVAAFVCGIVCFVQDSVRDHLSLCTCSMSTVCCAHAHTRTHAACSTACAAHTHTPALLPSFVGDLKNLEAEVETTRDDGKVRRASATAMPPGAFTNSMDQT